MAETASTIGEDESGFLTTGEQAYERVRLDIVFGHLQPGQRLTLDRLRTVYGVGIGTLREILSRLTPEGLVVAEGQRGFQVAPCSVDEFRELAELRLMIEGRALARSFEAGDIEWEGCVVSAHHKLARMEERLLAGEIAGTPQWKRYDFEFHRALVSASGSRALLDLHSTVYDRYLRYQMVFGVFRGAIAAEEHRELLRLALARDIDKALAVLESHIRLCVDFVIERGLLGRNVHG
ncbi:MAG: GntR family transcriptional regulator [Chelatococcus sp.]|nr:MAG: GntR family transcriptional regulator [Chelatococcus sp.]